MNLLTMKGITKAYTDKVLFENIDFSLEEGEKVGIVGVNGTGKSTLLRLLAGLEEYDSGEYTKGNHVVINYLPQNPTFSQGITILQYVCSLNPEDVHGSTLEGDAKTILNRLGFYDYDLEICKLSGGQKKKVALAAALLSKNEVLILDEPTNHLDNAMTEWLEDWLKSYKGALIMVTHDRYFLDLVCNSIVEIDRGKLYTYDTNYEGFLELKAEREASALSTQAKHANILRKELAWIRRGARARSTKQKAHIARYEALRDEEKIETVESVEITALSQRLGKKTIEIKDISKRFGQKCLVQNFTYTFLRDDRVGILGPNGCGKTTLMKMITGSLLPDEGHIEIGETVQIGYYAQEAEEMNPKQKAIDYIRDVAEVIRTEDGSISASQLLERFLFTGAMQHSPIEKLSGGEKRRLYLARVLMGAPNVLILDEPTNDLDIRTLCVLEDYLDTFKGILIVVSHDRYFLDRVVRRMLTFEEGGNVCLYNGSYTEYFQEHGIPSLAGFETATQEASERKQDAAQAWKEQKQKNKKLKFTYAEQKEYDTIEEDIASLEEQLTQIDAAILKAATDFPKLNQLTKEKEETEKALEEKMERYVYLEDLKATF